MSPRNLATIALVAVVAMALAALVALAMPGRATQRPPNVLVVVIDDLGIDKLSLYTDGPFQPRTPVIDGLAAEGVVFRNAWAMPACSPTRAAALTGRYARRTGVGGVINMWATPWGLSRDEVTLAEVVHQAPEPYATAAIGKWHLASKVVPDYLRDPNLQGFDVFAGSIGNLTYSHVPRPGRGYTNWERVQNGKPAFTTGYATTVNVDDTLRFVEKAGDQPWLVWLAFNAPHTPVHRPPDELLPGPYRENEKHGVAARMNAMLEALDTELGRLLDSLDPETRANTMVFVFGDNGTEHIWKAPSEAAGGHKTTIYEGGIRVPFVVSGPLVEEAGVSQGLVHVVDLLPTVAEVAGVDISELVDAHGDPLIIDGVSLLPYLRDPATPTLRDVVYTEQFFPNGEIKRPDAKRWDKGNFERAAVWDGTYKVIKQTNGYQYFAMTPDDPHERQPIDVRRASPEQRKHLAALRRRINDIQDDLQGWRPLDADDDDPPVAADHGPDMPSEDEEL